MSSLQANYQGVFDSALAFGNTPAVLVVDFINAYTTPGEKLYAPAVAKAVDASVELLELARKRGVPVIYTEVIYNQNGLDGGLFVQKVPVLRTMVRGEPMAEIVDTLAPQPSDVVLTKQYASAFFGTSLATLLTAQQIDTVVLIGCSTSGCIRASAVDGMQHGFRMVVPRECVGDRAQEPHEANLFDIQSKYGEVVPKRDVLNYFHKLPAPTEIDPS